MTRYHREEIIHEEEWHTSQQDGLIEEFYCLEVTYKANRHKGFNFPGQ